MEPLKIQAVNQRYSLLAESDCCLSCGGARERSGAKAGEVVVDLGCGRGQDVVRLSQDVGPAGRVHGVDLSQGMVDKARKTLEKFQVNNAEIHQATLENLPLGAQEADLVISNCVINHASDKAQVWKEIHRVLKKGGRFVVSDIYALEEVPEAYREDPQAVAECWAGSVTRQVYLDQIQAAGFSQVQILEESAPYDKGKIKVASWTLMGFRPSGCC